MMGAPMNRFVISLLTALFGVSSASAQTTPSYSKQIRPIITKYCLECHNAKTLKGTLNLETYKAMVEGKEKPTMPPPKAKFQPTKDEIALLRSWVAAGAVDDGANIKVELPVITAKVDVLPPVTGLGYSPPNKSLVIARNERTMFIDLGAGDTIGKE